MVEQASDYGLAEHVDEARSDDAALGIDFALGMGLAQVANLGDSFAADSDVSRIPGISGAIDNATVADDDVVAAHTRPSIPISVIGGCGNFPKGLTSNFLRGFRIRSERDVIDIGSEGKFLSVFGDDVAGEAFAVEHHLAIELVFGAERAGLRKDMAGAGGRRLNFR